jgi:hypothetical protein
MGDIKTSIILDLAGNLQSRARQFTGGLQRLGKQGSASMRLLGSGVSAASRGLDRLGSRYTALITGAAGIGAARMVGDLEERFVQMGIDANRGAEEMDALKKQIFDVAKAPDIRVDPGQITSAVEEIVQKTGDLKFAQENIRNIGLAISATGAEGIDIGGVMAEFQKMGLSAKEAFESLDTLNLQGKEGAFTLKNLAALGPRVVTSYTAMGRTGQSAMLEMGAALQVIRQGAGSSEMAATSFEALMRVLGDLDKVKVLQQGGIQVFDAEELKKGHRVLRPINELMKEMVTRYKGDKTIIQKVLGETEAARAFNSVVSEFVRTGAVESLDKFMKLHGDGSTLIGDSARKAGTFNASLRTLYTIWQQFADKELTGPIKSLTAALDGLKPGTVERWLNIGKYIMLIAGGLVIANKVGRGIAGAYKLGKGIFGKGAGGGLAGAAGGAMAPIPVYVVNKHLSMLPGKDGTFGGPGGTAGAEGKIMGVLGKAGALAAVGAISYELGGYLNQGLGAVSGWMTKGKHGGEGWLGDMLYDAIHGAKAKPVEVNGTIEVGVTDDRIKVKGIRSNKSGLDIDVYSGLTMVGP